MTRRMRMEWMRTWRDSWTMLQMMKSLEKLRRWHTISIAETWSNWRGKSKQGSSKLSFSATITRKERETRWKVWMRSAVEGTPRDRSGG
jgi:hypothetical protein